MLWLEKMEAKQKEGMEHPAFKLLGLWKRNLSAEASNKPAKQRWEMDFSKARMPSLRNVQAVNELYFARLWEWITTQKM